jgi:hypothetical protein
MEKALASLEAAPEAKGDFCRVVSLGHGGFLILRPKFVDLGKWKEDSLHHRRTK